MNTESLASPFPGVVWALYDLSLPGRAEALAKDSDEMRAAGGRLFTVGARSALADSFIDGLEMERHWLLALSSRNTLYALRTDLSSVVDGEVFLRAARRAVALAARIPSSPTPTMLYGAGIAESLAVWLTSRLTQIPFIASLTDDPRWSAKLLDQIRTEAMAVRTSSWSATLASLSSPAA